MNPPRSLRRFVLLICLGLLCAVPAAQADKHRPDPPGPVKNLTLTSGNQSITATWDPPDDMGSSPLSLYIVNCKHPDGLWQADTEKTPSTTFTQCGLHNPLPLAPMKTLTSPRSTVTFSRDLKVLTDRLSSM